MDFEYMSLQDISTLSTECLVIFLNASQKNLSLKIDAKWVDIVSAIANSNRMSYTAGDYLLVPLYNENSVENVLMVSVGENDGDQTPHNYRKALSAAWQKLRKIGMNEVTFALPEKVGDKNTCWMMRQAIMIGENINYDYNEMRSEVKKENISSLKKTRFILNRLVDEKSIVDTISESQAIASGVKLAKDLANAPANICTPSYLASHANKISADMGMEINVINLQQSKEMGMGAFVSVAQGSEEPALFIEIHYKNSPQKDSPPYVLVGKGITFDSGGISIKPSASMDEMKFDMCGAATVLGTLKTIATLKLPINVVGLIPATENMPSGTATKPGDIVKTLSGQTVEILNTDAEGRLVLCDALTYAERFNPKVVIDIATLTGACVVALGEEAAAIYTRDEDCSLRDKLICAGDETYDRAWPMPLWEEYQPQLSSKFADFSNMGTRWGGSITAACFLSRFTKKYKWAHLDIAGVSWTSGQGKAAATGRPVPLLSQWIIDESKSNPAV